MRVALLTPEYATVHAPDGGLANYIRKTAKSLNDKGHDVVVFTVSDRNRTWMDGRVEVCEVRRGGWMGSIAGRIPLVRRLAPLLDQYAVARRLASRFWTRHGQDLFDIVQVPSFMTTGYTLLKNGRVPLVCRASSYTPLLRSAYGRRREFFEYLTDWMEIRQVLDADASFAPSQLVADAYARIEGFRPQVILSPLDNVPVTPDNEYFQKQRPPSRYLLFFGTLSRIKGIDTLAEAITPVLQRHPDVSFLLIGRDDGLPNGQKCFEYIVSQCAPARNKLIHFEAMPKARLYPFIANAEAVVMPSRVDNYPNACLEAQMLGVPVIGSHNSSLEEMIVDGVTGFLAKNSDGKDLENAIERLLGMTGVEKEVMKQNIASHVERMEREDRVGKLVSFYETTISTFRGTKRIARAAVTRGHFTR